MRRNWGVVVSVVSAAALGAASAPWVRPPRSPLLWATLAALALFVIPTVAPVLTARRGQAPGLRARVAAIAGAFLSYWGALLGTLAAN